MPLFRKPDDRTVDAPYHGLDEELLHETLSNSTQKHLRFVRWGLRHNKGHYHEFLLCDEEDDGEDEDQDEDQDEPDD